MVRGSINIDDSIEKEIRNYMRKNQIKIKAKAINEILELFFENEIVFQNVKDLDKKIDKILSTLYLTKKLNEQIYSNLGFRENGNPQEDKLLKEFYNDIKPNRYRSFD